MRKLVYVVTAILVLASVFILARKNLPHYEKKVVSEQVQPGRVAPGPRPKIERPKTDVTETVKVPSEELDKIKEYAKEFDLPEEVEKELVEAAKRGRIEEDREEMTEQDLTEARIILRQIGGSFATGKGANVTSAYKVDDETFDELITASLPAGVSEDEGIGPSLTEPAEAEFPEEPTSELSPDIPDEPMRMLKSETLATIGFYAMADFNYEQAEKAFKTLLRYYGDSEVAPMVRLEYARLMLEQGHASEARKIVDEAIYQHGDDQEYVSLAEDLRAEIAGYE